MNWSRLFKCIVLLLAIDLQVIAQEKATTNISGIVTDSLFRPIEYAVIQLFSTQNSALSYGVVTVSDGSYRIKNVIQGTYQLKIGSVGFLSETKEIDCNKKNISLGPTSLKKNAIQLDDVIVKATRTGVREKIDKTIFVPDSISLSTARTGLDIVNKIPEVRVDKSDQSVSVLGNKNVLVLINGIDNKRSLISIQPSDIEHIELITHPSAKYNSDVASVINIVLKNFNQKGLSLSSNLYLCLDKKNHSGNLQLDYGMGKWRVFVSYAGNYKLTTGSDSTYRQDTDRDTIITHSTYPISNHTSDVVFNRFQYGFDYTLNKTNFLSFTSRIVSLDFKSFRKNLLTSSIHEQITNQSQIGSEFKSNKIDQNYSLYYLHKFKKEDEKLELHANYYTLNQNAQHLIRDSMIIPLIQRDLHSRSTNRENNQNSFNLRVDYAKPIIEKLTSEFGYLLYSRKIRSETNTTFTNNSVLSYHDQRNSVYANALYGMKRWSFQAGARLENFNIKVDNGGVIKNNQTKLLPYVSFFFEPDANNSLKLIYRKYLEYPVYSALHPFKYYAADSLSYYTGNPYLKPEQNNHLSLKYTYRKKKNYLSLHFNYDLLNDLIVQNAVIENNKLAYSYENAGKAKRYGAVLSLTSYLFDFVEVELLMKGNYTNFISKKTHSGYSYATEYGIYLPFFWDIDVEITGILKERVCNYNGYNEYGGNIDEVLFTKSINKNLSVGFAIRQPFFRPKDRDKTWGNTFTEINKQQELRSTSYLFNVTYFFKSGKEIKKRKEDSYMESPQEKNKQAK